MITALNRPETLSQWAQIAILAVIPHQKFFSTLRRIEESSGF